MRNVRKNMILFVLLVSTISPLFAQTYLEQYLNNILLKETLEVPVYQFDTAENAITFRVNYAKPIIKNAKDWAKKPKEHIPYQVDLIYTKYPFQFQDWRTNYDTLLMRRIENLQALDPLLKESSVRWRFILQTGCKTEAEAMKMFHGFVVYHHPVPQPILLPVPPEEKPNASVVSIPIRYSEKDKEKKQATEEAESLQNATKKENTPSSTPPAEEKKEPIVKGGKTDGKMADPNINRELDAGAPTLPTFKSGYADSKAFWAGDNTDLMHKVLEGKVKLKDSLVYSILDRHKNWKNMLVVMDWTGSMYVYGAQLLLWHQQQMKSDSSKVKHFVLFNDGNKKPNHLKTNGQTGGIYFNDDYNISSVIDLMTTVMKSGLGGDIEENDLEAITKAIAKYDDFDEVILIGDNSGVRDIDLLSQIQKPIHVIICDAGRDYAEINPQYARIAFETGGSLHTFNKDFMQLEDIYKVNSMATLGGYYEMRKGKMVKIIK
ncbi:MAG: hypothetical protein ACKVTZ_19385 [Bacteroidia bacterium]